jgi:type I restriction enzyme S subunit
VEVRLGYKQTEVGVIPESWEVASLSSLSKEPMQNGLFFKPSLKGSGVKLINVGDLYARVPINSDDLELFEATDEERERFKVEDGDLFFTRSSIVASGIAHCNIYRSSKPESAVFDSHVIRLRPDKNKVVPSYLFRFCVATFARRYLVSHAKSATMTTIDQGVLGKCPVLLPPHEEQEAIAEALSDADALIESLKLLLAKKRVLKQGAIQELLTGKKRLPGFEAKPGRKQAEGGVIPQDWEVRLLRDIVDFTNGKPHERNVEADGRYWLITLDSIGIDGELKAEHKRTNMLDYSLRKNDIVSVLSDLAHGNLLGLCDIIPQDSVYVLNQRMGRLRLKVPAAARFIRLQINRRQEHFRKRGQGTSQKHIYKRDFDVLPIPFPPPPEQEAIAAVISDMDADITALKAKLAKVRQLKQGMMQEMLTGRIRLV